VLVTGGARGVTAETAVALARTSAPHLVLLGRSPAPTPEPSWLAPLSDESEIKRALVTELNGNATPKDVGERYHRIAANREVLQTLQRIESAGARVTYRQADVRDEQALRQMVENICTELGPIKGLVHGAGVLADRRIEDKTLDQFQTVYETKVNSLETLLEALRGDDLRVVALFSSSTARFGRTGQVDYAVANEVLNKLAQREATLRPDCRVVSFNWGPWDGGMVNAALKKVFANEGVGVIPLHAGGDYFVREISQPGPVEVVVMAGLQEQGTNVPRSPVADKVAFEREVSLAALPVLRAHMIKGHPVLPMALIIEWLAHGALHANPGLAFHGFNDLQILKGVILADEQPVTVRVLTGKAVKDGTMYRVPVEMRSGTGRETIHSRAEIVLTAKLPSAPLAGASLSGLPYSRHMADLYREVLFHGPDLQGIEQVDSCSPTGIVATVSSAPAPATWIKQPLRTTWLADPLVLDSAFQIMIVWSQEQYGAGSLPCSAGSYRQYRRAFPQGTVRVVARVTKQAEHRALADIDFVDAAGDLIAQLTGYECVIDPSLNQAFRGQQLAAVPSS
jgi:NAD(P)-dependent dehydrogenase (short-subunit alcohol dehydrogenase family)